jgi:hypothetical protein
LACTPEGPHLNAKPNRASFTFGDSSSCWLRRLHLESVSAS